MTKDNPVIGPFIGDPNLDAVPDWGATMGQVIPVPDPPQITFKLKPPHNGYTFEDGVMSVYIPEDHINSHTYAIFSDILPRAMQLFAAKNAAYATKDGTGNASERFGVVAQFMKMVGKLDKLEGPLFEEQGKGPELEFEPVEEVLFDLIGHALETIYLYNKGREK